jgi:hypothetical protein
MLYELARRMLGDRLDVHPKAMTIVGSARIGYSLAPPRFGVEFHQESDLDFVAVDAPLFDGLAHTFSRWRDDWTSGRQRPLNPTEEQYWKNNLIETPSNLQRGFINSWRLPNRRAYPLVRRISQALYVLRASLPGLGGRRASLRAYRDWRAFTDQVSMSLARACGVPPGRA